MNGNLSNAQFGSSSMSANGAMPNNHTFDGDGAPHVQSSQGVGSANADMHIPKPGFF